MPLLPADRLYAAWYASEDNPTPENIAAWYAVASAYVESGGILPDDPPMARRFRLLNAQPLPTVRVTAEPENDNRAVIVAIIGAVALLLAISRR